MKYLLPLLLSSCAAGAPAYAEVATFKPRMTLLPEQEQCFAVIEVHNRLGRYNEVEVISTEYGDVFVEYTTVGGHNPEDNDLVEVLDWPESVVVSPMSLSIKDGDKGYICLMLNNLS